MPNIAVFDLICGYFQDIFLILHCDNISRLIYERKCRFKVW